MRTVILFLALSFASLALGQSFPVFKPGDAAPKLSAAEWMHGDPFAGWDRKKLNVVEFWATWCEPCKEAMPHLSELAKKYPEVGFYSISFEEQPQTVPDGVRRFVQANLDRMQYSVGRDTAGNDDWAYWIMGSKQRGIPVAYIVDSSGKVLWIGHPLNLDKPIADALAGKLDVAKERRSFEEYLDDQAKLEAFLGKLPAAEKKFESGDRKGSFHDFDRAAGKNPDFRYTVAHEKIRLLAIYDGPGCLAFLKDLRGKVEREDWWRYLVEFAAVDQRVKDRQAYDDLRAKAAEEFLKAGRDKDAYLLAYGGWVLRLAGRKDEAESAFDRAVEVFGRSSLGTKPDERERFEGFVKQVRG